MISGARLAGIFLFVAVSSSAGAQDVAVDPAIVERQKVELRADCKTREVGRPHVDCDCFVDNFADERLRLLREQIASLNEAQRSVCSTGGKNCAGYKQLYEWTLTRDAQINFPTRVGAPLTLEVRGPIVDSRERFYELFYTNLSGKCANKKPVAVQPDKQCLTRVQSENLIKAAGMSPEFFCGCVTQMTAQGMEENKAYEACAY